jgi:hypothetical protein
MTEVALPDQITVGSFFLETLTTGMYESPFHCIREYIQNSFDAIHDAIAADLLRPADGRVVVTISGTGARQILSIRDNGAGAPLNEAVERFVSLGASHKRPQRHAGFRGIGRLAGIAYCTTLRFRTKASGEAEATILSFDCAKLRGFMAPGAEPKGVSDVIRESVTASQVSDRDAEHYTEVEMIGLTGAGLEFIDPSKLGPYLSQYCPIDYSGQFPFGDQIRKYAEGLGHPIPTLEVELRIRRDHLRITKPYKKSYPPPADDPGTRDPSTLIRIEVVSSQENGWFGWFGVSNFPGEIPDLNVAGIRFRQKNIQIGDSTLIESIAASRGGRGSDRRLQRWAVGEIFVVNTAVVPNARRDGFEDNETWRRIRDDMRAVTGSVVKLIRASSKNRNVLKRASKAVAEKKKTLQEASDSATRQAVDEELASQLSKIERAVKGGADAKEASELVAQIKEIQESLRDLPKPKSQDSALGAQAGPGSLEEDVDDDDEPWLLELVREVLEEKLEAGLAAEIMTAIYERLGDDEEP